MGISGIGHSIRWARRGGNEKDDFTTPAALAESCVGMVPFQHGDTFCDPFRGSGAFHRHMPEGSAWYEIKEQRDFFRCLWKFDWLISNPPYSMIDRVLEHSASVSLKGFGYLLAAHAITPRRIQMMEARGFGLAHVHLCKIFSWFGMNAFCVWVKGAKSVIQYDRVVWQ